MNTNEAIKQLNEWEFKCSAYNLLLNTTYFDTSTIAPKDGAEYRNERIAYILGEAYEIQTDPHIKELLKEMSKMDLDEVNKRKVELYLKEMCKLDVLPKDFYKTYQKELMEAEINWTKAKEEKNYKLFENNLLNLIEYTKQIAKYRDPNHDVYDLLLNDYEPGFNKLKYDEFFDLIKKELLPLIKEIANKPINDDLIYKHYNASKQAILMETIKDYLGYDKAWGYMGVSAHPFTNGFSCDDVRVTTLYDENNISSSIYSIIHEVGHAFYEHQVNHDFDGSIIKTSISSGMHESQSRLFENYLGRKKEFIQSYYPKLQELYPDILKDVSLDKFYNLINVSKPSLIRTDADELTYPIHILIRYELEKAIFNNTIDLNNLDKEWNKKYEEYLGISANDDAMGILQDIHWSGASFGYFPTYALGSAVAAQIYYKMSQDINIDEALLNNNFKAITDYLKEHVHQYGNLYDLDEILIKLTNEGFNPKYYIDYLKNKYQAIYSL